MAATTARRYNGRMRILVTALALAGLVSQTPSAAVMSVAGIYQIDITVVSSGCAGLPAGTNTRRAFGVVSHAPGGTHVVIESDRPGRAPRNIAARLSADGSFTVRPDDGSFREGRFTDRGFTATEATSAGGCEAEATWRAAKQGDRNVIASLLPDGGASFLVAKAVTSNTCTPSENPPPMIGTGASIARTPTGARFVLNDHGTRNMSGTVGTDGAFEIPRSESIVMEKIHAADTFSQGRFDQAGFSMTVTTDLDANPDGKGGPCRMVTAWRGTRFAWRPVR